MSSTRDYIDYLNAKTDIAPANSQEELDEARLIQTLMEQHGLETTLQEFEANGAGDIPHAVALLALFIGIVLAGIIGTAAQVVGFVLILACAVLFVMRFALGRDVLAGLGARARSQNVIGIHRADGPLVTKGNRPIVVMAHYDTPNENFLYQEPFARYQALLRRVSPDLAIAVFVCGLVQAMMFLPEPLRRVFWIVGIICCLPLLLIGISYAYERFAPCTVGANDNKSGVAAMLGVMDDVHPGPDDAKQYAVEHPYVEPSKEDEGTEELQDDAAWDGDDAQEGAEPDSGVAPVADTVLRPAAVSSGVLEDKAAGEADDGQPADDDAYVPGGYDEDGQIVDGYEDAGAYADDGPAAQPAMSIVERARDLFGGLTARFGSLRGSGQPEEEAAAASEDLADEGDGQSRRSLVSQHRGPAPTVAAAPRGQAADWEHAQAEDDRYQYEEGSEDAGPLEDRAVSKDGAASGFQLDAGHPQRHGLETIESLEMLPEDCEVVYRKPAQRRARLAQVPTVEAEEAPAAQGYAVEREDFGGGAASQQTVTEESFEPAPDGTEPRAAADDLEGEPYIPYEPEGDYGQEGRSALAAFGQKASEIARAVADWFKQLWARIVELVEAGRDKAAERKAQHDAQKAEEAERKAEELARQQEEAARADAEAAAADAEEPESEPPAEDAPAEDAALQAVPEDAMPAEPAAGAGVESAAATYEAAPAQEPDDAGQGLPVEDYEDYGVVEDQDYLDEDRYEDEAYGAEDADAQPEVEPTADVTEPEPAAAAQDDPASDDTERLDATAAYEPIASDATQPLDGEAPAEPADSAPASQDAIASQRDVPAAPAPVMAEGLTFSQEQEVSDEELELKDASGLDTLSADDIHLPADQKPKPEPIDDPSWGKSEFNPAASVARRAVLFDLPNPASNESVDPFASEASEDVIEEASVLDRHQVAEDAAPAPAEQGDQAPEDGVLPDGPSDPTASLEGTIDETARLAPLGSEDAVEGGGQPTESDVTAPLPSNGKPYQSEASGAWTAEKIPTDDAVADMADSNQADPDLMAPASDDAPAVDVGEAQPLETLTGDSMRPTYMDEPSYGFDGEARPAGGSHKRKKKAHGGLRGLFSRKKKQDTDEESLSDWLGVSDDYDAKKDGRAIGTWSNFEQEEHDLDQRPDDGSWKGGAAMRSNLRVVGDEEDLPIDEYGQVIQPPQPTEEEMRDQILHMGDDELICHDIYFVAVGANGLSNSGAAAFINQFRSDIRGCYLVNLDSVGAGDLTLLTKEGLDNPRRADRRTVRMLSGVFSDLHLPFQRRSYEGASTDATYAMRSRIRATTIMGQTASGIRAQSHVADDEPASVDRKQVADVADVVTEFIRRS